MVKRRSFASTINYTFPLLEIIPLHARFDGSRHHIFETHTVLKLRIFAKVNIQNQKIAIQDQNMASISASGHIISVMGYVLYNREPLQTCAVSKKQFFCKIISPNLESRYLGSKLWINIHNP